jgi:hypothetical protein
MFLPPVEVDGEELGRVQCASQAVAVTTASSVDGSMTAEILELRFGDVSHDGGMF